MTFHDEDIEEPRIKHTVDSIQPIIIGPFRFIEPYPFTFQCNAKRRWYGCKLIDKFAQEFKHWDRKTLVQRIENHQILVNGHPITVDYIIKEHDFITHSIIRTESPVYNEKIEKLGETTNYIAFLKPSSVPVHATGGYFYNSMVKRLDARYYPVHRLDKVTSGIIVMAKTEDSARTFGKYLESHQIEKTYIARVMGEFPDGEIRVDAPILENPKDRTVRVCGPGGKESLTIFKRISTNGRESIVECHPITGRTHQIRVHLAHLNHPISNDPMYGGKYIGFTKAEKEALKEAHRLKLWPPDTILSKDDDKHLVFGIFLRSVHYKSDEFDFKAPMPDWIDLDKFCEERSLLEEDNSGLFSLISCNLI